MNNTSSPTSSPAAAPKNTLWKVVALLIGIAVVAGIITGFARKRPPGAGFEPIPLATPVALPVPDDVMSASPEADAQTQKLEQVGTSSDVDAIEKALGTTDFAGADKEIADIEKELGR